MMRSKKAPGRSRGGIALTANKVKRGLGLAGCAQCFFFAAFLAFFVAFFLVAIEYFLLETFSLEGWVWAATGPIDTPYIG